MSKEPSEFWEDEFKTPAMDVRLHLKSIGEEVDGDAPIEAPGSHTSVTPPPPSAAVGVEDVSFRAPPRTRQGSSTQQLSNKRPVENEYKYNANRRRKRLCLDFQSGHCKECKPGTSVCPDDPELRHQCAKCLSFEHGADECGNTNANKGKGKGKGKGKESGKGKQRKGWSNW